MISYTVKANGKQSKAESIIRYRTARFQRTEHQPQRIETQGRHRIFCRFVVTTTEPEPLIPAGHDIASEQFRLPIEPLAMTGHKASGKTTVSTDGDIITVLSPRMQFVFNKRSGLVTSYKVNGTEYFAEGLVFSLTSGAHRRTMIMVTVGLSASKYGNSPARISM